MTIETFVAREEPDPSRSTEREYLRADWNVLAAPNIRFDVRQRRPLDPSLDETVVNPVWARARMMCDD